MSYVSPRADDPTTVPVLPASTVLVVDDRPALEVLVLRRRAGSDFVGGMYVFPGGGVDDEDGDPAWATRLVGVTDEAASSALGVDHGGLAYWVAALRETYEEAGVLLASDGVGAGPASLRQAVDRDELPFLTAVESMGVTFDLSRVQHVGRWVTPVGPRRRYDTQFFVAALPAGQEASHDGVEAVALEWVAPEDALARWRDGTLRMLPPTVCMLQQLAGFASVDDVLADAASGPPAGATPRTRGRDDGRFEVTLPGDPGHADGKDVLGWVRLGLPRTAQ